ncbi:hypothetical protein [Fibrivirga algicola]|uniref:Uncharacterized protein n=1 Tax=Fibrivirga algicola TaxID=2950420 RepID=A0ABX0QPQ9_9BACT|nr:hypothetical protein [Fibrivirga algicola]NID13778.1 hypothetical protein [Fibrivirga algicola]
MKSLLTWQEALTIMRRLDGNGLPVPFSMTAITANQSRQTGGDIIRFERAVLCRRGDKDNDAIDGSLAPARFVPHGPLISIGIEKRLIDIGLIHRPKPNWMYRIRSLESNQIRQVHLHLILFINEHPVR